MSVEWMIKWIKPKQVYDIKEVQHEVVVLAGRWWVGCHEGQFGAALCGDPSLWIEGNVKSSLWLQGEGGSPRQDSVGDNTAWI